MDLVQEMEVKLSRQVLQEKLKKTYLHSYEQPCKDDVVSCCFYLCFVHIKLILVHWLVPCHELA